MTDKELLKLAAKASGMTLCSEWDCSKDGIFIGTGKGDLTVWNPLTNDGDALRLAVMLEMDVAPMSEVTEVLYWVNRELCELDSVKEHVIDCDKVAATRRAIVRAAAEIGKSL
jgi:hypothetical protein